MKSLPRWVRRCLGLLAGLALLAGAIYVSRDFWFRQLRAYALGYAYVTAESRVRLLPKVDRLEIYALKLAEQTPADPEVKINDSPLAYLRRVELTGERAEQVARLWRQIRYEMNRGKLCHHPSYALRFHGQDGQTFETSVCWGCQNFTLPVGLFGFTEYGFDAEDKAAQALLAELKIISPATENTDPAP